MLLTDLVKNKSYDYIECRIEYVDKHNKKHDEFWGTCKAIDGVIISLDGDTYDDVDVARYDEWTDYETGAKCLTVWEEGELELW